MSKGTAEGEKIPQGKIAYRTIRANILGGQYAPGMPLVENDLVELLEMSRTPIREALQKLEDDGLVSRVRNKGYFVKVITKADISQCYEALEALEGMLCYLLATEVTEEIRQRLQFSVEQMESALESGDVDLWAEADSNFHDTIRKSSHNRIISDTVKKLNTFVRGVREMVSKAGIDKRASTLAHRKTFEAIRDGDAELARRTMQDHIRDVRAQLLKLI